MFCQWLENYLGTGLSRKLLPTCCLMIRGCLGPWLAKAGQLWNWIYFSKHIHLNLFCQNCTYLYVLWSWLLFMKLYCISAYDMPGVCVAIKWHMLFNQIEGSIWGNFTAPGPQVISVEPTKGMKMAFKRAWILETLVRYFWSVFC